MCCWSKRKMTPMAMINKPPTSPRPKRGLGIVASFQLLAARRAGKTRWAQFQQYRQSGGHDNQRPQADQHIQRRHPQARSDYIPHRSSDHGNEPKTIGVEMAIA